MHSIVCSEGSAGYRDAQAFVFEMHGNACMGGGAQSKNIPMGTGKAGVLTSIEHGRRKRQTEALAEGNAGKGAGEAGEPDLA